MSKLTKSMWLRRVGPISLAGALVLPLGLTGAEKTAELSVAAQAEAVYNSNHAAMKSLLDDVELTRRNAVVAASDGKYEEALSGLNGALKKIEKLNGDFAVSKRSEIRNNIKRIKRVYSSEIMKKANKFAADKKYDKALDEAQKAHILTPEREYITNFILECQKHLQAKKFTNQVTLESVSPDYASRQKNIDMNLREAQLLIRNNKLENAIIKLERVLLVDPYNLEAVNMLSLVYKRLYNMGVDRSRESELITQARNSWEWAEPLSRIAVQDMGTGRQADIRKKSNTDLYNKLEAIEVEKVPHGTSTVGAVIRYMNDIVKNTGVVVLSKFTDQSENNRPVSLDLGRSTMLDIIRYFSMASGLSYSFNGNQVIFGNVDNLSTESFPVRSDIIAEIIDSKTSRTTSSGMKSMEGGGGGDGAPDEGGTETVADDTAAPAVTAEGSKTLLTAAALKNYFEKRWVTFGPGSNIIYNPATERLLVRNTTENLRRMGALLRQLDALDKPLILVEIKMIELNDTNLNELGFEWTFSAGRSKGNGWSLGTNDPTRHGTGDPENGGQMFRVLNDLKIFPNFGEKIFGDDMNVDLSLSINAVAQNRQAEVLASPRILSENAPARPAEIKMIEKTYFITEWEQPDMESDGFNIKLEGDQPDWDDGNDLGVTFSVKPEALTDNYTIKLNDIKPIFLTHTKDHDNPMTYGVFTEGNGQPRTWLARREFNLKMPELARREITTNITLYDGETVLIGGMVDNETSTRDDKWPFLGEIPFIGNFFRDQQNNISNRTMLMFITARLMTPKGTPWNPGSTKNRGLVDFTR